MKIKDFLYRLNKPKSITTEETAEMQNCINQAPFLTTMDSQNNFPVNNYQDTSSILESYANQDYISGLKNRDSLINNKFNTQPSSDFDAEIKGVAHQLTENIEKSIKQKDTSQIVTKELYQVEESDFVKYLSTLPVCKSPDEIQLVIKTESPLMGKSIVPEQKNIHVETDELIKSSLELNQSVSSESLANLWASQGKPELAIQMYEKLATEFPEKNAIFAAKIEKLKSENSL